METGQGICHEMSLGFAVMFFMNGSQVMVELKPLCSPVAPMTGLHLSAISFFVSVTGQDDKRLSSCLFFLWCFSRTECLCRVIMPPVFHLVCF